MRKLDNRGWSFVTFILFLLLLLSLLLLISYLANEFSKNFPRYSNNIEIVTQKKSLI